MNVRKYFGFPSVDTPVDAFIFLAIVLAYARMWDAASTHRMTPGAIHDRRDLSIILSRSHRFILNLVALVSPTWIDFYDSNNRYYSLGLWTACSPQYCGYAWGRSMTGSA